MEKSHRTDEKYNRILSTYTYTISPDEYESLRNHIKNVSLRSSNSESSGGLGVVLNSLIPYPPNSDSPEYYVFKSSSPNTQLEDFFS